jgi:hypothetical protein
MVVAKLFHRPDHEPIQQAGNNINHTKIVPVSEKEKQRTFNFHATSFTSQSKKQANMFYGRFTIIITNFFL